MYGLPQAGIIPQQLLEKQLNKKGYHQNDITPGLWKQKWRPICFLLCVDDFGVKYVGKHNAKHLMSVLGDHYEISHNWKGKRYLGIYLDWDYGHRKVHLSMLLYVTDTLTRFRQQNPQNLQHQLYPHIRPTYGAKAQYMEDADVSPPLSIADNVFTRSHGKVSVICTGSISCYADSIWIHQIKSRKPNGAHDAKSETIIRLCVHPPWYHTHILRKWHGPSGPYWRLVPPWNKIQNHSRGIFLYVKQHGVTYQQRSSVDYSKNH